MWTRCFLLASGQHRNYTMPDGLLWILQHNDHVMGIHYLDDFLLFGAPLTSVRGVSGQSFSSV